MVFICAYLNHCSGSNISNFREYNSVKTDVRIHVLNTYMIIYMVIH